MCQCKVKRLTTQSILTLLELQLLYLFAFIPSWQFITQLTVHIFALAGGLKCQVDINSFHGSLAQMFVEQLIMEAWKAEQNRHSWNCTVHRRYDK